MLKSSICANEANFLQQIEINYNIIMNCSPIRGSPESNRREVGCKNATLRSFRIVVLARNDAGKLLTCFDDLAETPLATYKVARRIRDRQPDAHEGVPSTNKIVDVVLRSRVEAH